MTKNRIKTLFKNGRPRKDWFLQFTKGHKLLIKSFKQWNSPGKNALSLFIINEYFQKIKRNLIILIFITSRNIYFN